MPTHEKDVCPLTQPTHLRNNKSCVVCVGSVSHKTILTQPTLPMVSFSRASMTRRLWKVTVGSVGCVRQPIF
jgi:hypothetical protein